MDTLKDVALAEGWTTDLPFNVRFKVQYRNGHSRGKAFYHPEREEVVHRVYNDRRTYPAKMYAMVTDLSEDAHREEQWYRKLLPGVEDDTITIWSGSSGRTLEQVEIGGDGNHYGPSARTQEEAARIVDNALRQYMQEGRYSGDRPTSHRDDRDWMRDADRRLNGTI